jgi:hypothetical protein
MPDELFDSAAMQSTGTGVYNVHRWGFNTGSRCYDKWEIDLEPRCAGRSNLPGVRSSLGIEIRVAPIGLRLGGREDRVRS